MTIDAKEILEIAMTVAKIRNIRVTVNKSMQGAAVCGTAAFIGGVLLGPRGLALGGALGGLAAAAMNSGEFKPAYVIIRDELSASEKQILIRRIVNVLRSLDMTDLTLLLPIIMRKTNIQDAVTDAVSTFFKSDMQMTIID